MFWLCFFTLFIEIDVMVVLLHAVYFIGFYVGVGLVIVDGRVER